MIRYSERGLSLIEIIVSMVIAGVVVPALMQAVLIGIRTLDGTNQRIAGSNDTLLVASYFTSDVEGASSVATGGSRGHVTPNVALPSGTTSVAMVMLYAVRGAATVGAPATAGGTTIWNRSQGAVTSASADELLAINDDNRNDTLSRVATTATPTSSITHTIALRPTGSVTRFGAASGGATANALQLTEAAAVTSSDVLIAHITAAATASQITPPAGWTEVERQNLSNNLTSIAYYLHGPVAANTSWQWRFPAGETHDIAGGIVGYANIAAGAPMVDAATTNPCGGETPVVAITTADNFAVSSAAYFLETNEGENQLLRRSCSATGLEAVQVLARQLQATAGATVTCQPVVCDPLPASVTLRLREPPPRNETRGRSYVLSARSRTG